jgi:hypothetical protein
MVDEVLAELSPRFTKMYAKRGRPSIAPEKLLRALLLQVLYTIRSERQLMEQLDYNMLYRWFVGLNMDDPIWNVTVFTKNRERLLKGDIAQGFFQRCWNRRAHRVCCRRITSQWTERWSKPGQDRRVFNAKTSRRNRPQTEAAIQR